MANANKSGKELPQAKELAKKNWESPLLFISITGLIITMAFLSLFSEWQNNAWLSCKEQVAITMGIPVSAITSPGYRYGKIYEPEVTRTLTAYDFKVMADSRSRVDGGDGGVFRAWFSCTAERIDILGKQWRVVAFRNIDAPQK